MPGTTSEALAGYILEEMLAYLLRNAGYNLLTDASQDPSELANRHHGLVVRGRGAEHQVDVLGELAWIPAFTFPLRLVLEAKCRKGKTQISTVREMIAALLDINQNNWPRRSTERSLPVPRPKYAYVGAIFSASGFSSVAEDFALAHAVSLVDLRVPGLNPLVAAARNSGQLLRDYYQAQGHRTTAKFVRTARNAMRNALGTDRRPIIGIQELMIPDECIRSAIQASQDARELFIGMATGPYMLVLKADDTAAFLQYSAQYPTHHVLIHWSRSDDSGYSWRITPIDGPAEYQLRFKLPEQLAKWVFGAANVRRAALQAKEQFFSTITIYRHLEQRDEIIRLKYRTEDADVRRP